MSKKKAPKPSEVKTEPAPARDDEYTPEERMADYLWEGTVDGECYDGDPADLDFF